METARRTDPSGLPTRSETTSRSLTIGIELVIFDLDGTLIAHDEPIWKTLHEHFGSDKLRRRDLVRRGIAGEIPYSQWFAGDVAMLREQGATRRAIEELLSRLRPTEGAAALVQELRARAVRVAVVSGGIQLILPTVMPTVVFDEVFINRLQFDDSGALVGGSPTPYDRAGKADALRLLAKRYDVDVASTAFVGDGANDLAIMAAAGLGIAWGPSPPQSLLDLATHHRQGDMRQLLELLTH